MEETNKIQSKHSKESNFKDESEQKNEEGKHVNEGEEEAKKTVARRKSIQKWMDKNHYSWSQV